MIWFLVYAVVAVFAWPFVSAWMITDICEDGYDNEDLVMSGLFGFIYATMWPIAVVTAAGVAVAWSVGRFSVRLMSLFQ